MENVTEFATRLVKNTGITTGQAYRVLALVGDREAMIFLIEEGEIVPLKPDDTFFERLIAKLMQG